MTARATWRLAAVLGVLAVASAAVAVWAYVEQPLADRVDVGELAPEALDTLSLADRQVTASLTGSVQRLSGGEAFVGTPAAAVRVLGEAADSLRLGDRVLVVGRVRDGLDGRYLDAEALSVVRLALRPGERRSGERPTVQPED